MKFYDGILNIKVLMERFDIPLILLHGSWLIKTQKWPKFAMDSRNLRLDLATDDFNPFSNMRSRCNCWPVILVTYNLPRLGMKKENIMLILLISGHRQRGNDIHVYLD